MTFDPRDAKTYESASDETLIQHGAGHGGDFSGNVNVEATRRLRRSIEEFNKASTTGNEALRHSIEEFSKISASGNETLRRSIDDFNASSTRQANVMIRLGWVTVLLSAAMLIFSVVQVWVALRH